MAKFTFTGNNASGYTDYGPYHFPTGEAVEVDDADEDTIRRLKNSKEFKVGKAKVSDLAPSQLVGLNKTDLLEIAASEGVETEDDATNKEIVAAIELARKG